MGFNITLTSPLAPYEPLPKGVRKEDLTAEFLDTSKMTTSFISLDDETAKLTEN